MQDEYGATIGLAIGVAIVLTLAATVGGIVWFGVAATGLFLVLLAVSLSERFMDSVDEVWRAYWIGLALSIVPAVAFGNLPPALFGVAFLVALVFEYLIGDTATWGMRTRKRSK